MDGNTYSVDPGPPEPALGETKRQRIVVETANHRIEGTIDLPPDGYRARLSDYLNRETPFIALTEAEKVPLSGGPSSSHSFLAVAKTAVVVAFPHNEL